MALALCAVSSRSDQAAIAAVLAEHGREGFLVAWLEQRGVAWAAELVPGIAADIEADRAAEGAGVSTPDTVAAHAFPPTDIEDAEIVP